jgi:hypothetical protein
MNETELAALKKQLWANSLGLVLLNVDLNLYKAQIAQRRWGTPGGNDVAQVHYGVIEQLLERTRWPEALDDAVKDFSDHLTIFRGHLKAMDVTRVSYEATRLANAFAALQQGLETWAAITE